MVTKSQSRGQQKADEVRKSGQQKADEVRKKAAVGTTKPIPTADDTPSDKRAEAARRADELAAKITEDLEKKRAEIKALQEELKKKKAEEKAKRDAVKNKREEEKKLALAERVKKEKAVQEADKAIEKAQADLELTEEWKVLQAAKKAREEIGPLPKVRRPGGGGRGSSNGLTPNMVKILSAMKSGGVFSRAEITEATGILRGKRLIRLVEMELLDELVPEEGQRSKQYQITAKGREALEKALNESD